MANNHISIRNLLDCGVNDYINYKDRIVISYIRDLSLFDVPCHLNATTILVCLGGEFDGSVNLKTYHLGQYSVLINFPENIIQTSNVRNVRAFAIIMSSDFVRSLPVNGLSYTQLYYYDITQNNTFVLPREEIQNLSNYLSILRHTMTSLTAPQTDSVLLNLSTAFISNIMLLHHRYHTDYVKVRHLSKRNYIIMDKFLELLRVYDTEERHVNFYADKLFLSPKYLSTVVKRVSGKKPNEWITEYVIMEAKSMLKYSGKNIQQVAYALNFPSQSAFGKYFKEEVGMSPSEFVQKSRGC